MITKYLKDFFGGECFIVEVNSFEELKDLFDGLNREVKKQHKPDGTTTRAVDDIIQTLFEEGVCIIPIKDPEKYLNIDNKDLEKVIVVDETVNKENGVREILDKVAHRLEYEHQSYMKYKMNDDFIRIILENETHD